MIIYSHDGWEVLFISFTNEYLVIDEDAEVLVNCYANKDLAIEICKNHCVVI